MFNRLIQFIHKVAGAGYCGYCGARIWTRQAYPECCGKTACMQEEIISNNKIIAPEYSSFFALSADLPEVMMIGADYLLRVENASVKLRAVCPDDITYRAAYRQAQFSASLSLNGLDWWLDEVANQIGRLGYDKAIIDRIR